MSTNLKQISRLVSAALFAVLFISVSYSYAADQEMFEVYSFEVEGDIQGFETGDFNGDNLTDIIIIYSPHNDRFVRYLGLYLHKQPVDFRPRADFIITLPSSVVQIDVADIDNDGLDEILLIDNDGVVKVGYSAESGLQDPDRIIETKTIFSVPFIRGIIIEPFVYDLMPQPGNEIIIPTFDGYAVYALANGGKWQKTGQMNVPLTAHLPDDNMKSFSSRENQELHMVLPRLELIDGNLDGKTDLYFLWKNKVCCFFGKESGGFPEEPDFTLYFASDHQTGYQQSFLADCNGDRYPDLVILSSTGGISKTETKIRVYLSDRQGKISSEFSDEKTLSDSHSNLILNDFNHDLSPEIVIPAIEMGTFAATKIFLTKKADMHLLIYSIKAGQIANEPDKRLKYEFKFNFDDINPMGELSINWDGDYNADGLLDAAFCDGKGRVLFYWGKNGNYLSDNPDLEISLNHPARVYPVNLNSDNKSDIIVAHNLGGRYDRLSVLMNKSN